MEDIKDSNQISRDANRNERKEKYMTSGRLDTVEENSNEFEGKTIETISNDSQREKN